VSPTDDLTPVLRQPPDNVGVRYGQGKLLAWNPDTFENTVLWRGATLTNLDVLAGPAANSFTPGITVALIGWAPGGGASSWAIFGQWVSPGSGAAAAQIQFMNSSLASQISAEVFAARIRTAEVGDYVEISSTDWIDLPGSPGPTLTDIEVSSTGVMLVEVGCFVSADDNAGYMSVEVSGATSRAPTLRHIVSVLAAAGDGPNAIAAGRQFPVTGLNPGLHTVTAKYRTDSTSSPGALFGDRTLDVISF
jgi:hypothetical protein